MNLFNKKYFSYLNKDKKLLLKPLTFQNQNEIFSIFPVKAIYGVIIYNKKIKYESITVKKSGFLIIEIIPF